MAIITKSGIDYTKSSNVKSKIFERSLLGGSSTITITDEFINLDSIVKFYSSDKNMVIVNKEISGNTLSAVLFSRELGHNVKIVVTNPNIESEPVIEPIIYGYRMNNSVNNPDNCITYLEDAIGNAPAAMNFSTGKFDYGSWANAFFMPRPCMLKYDGRVAYYLDPNDYTKKEDGTPSDVGNVNFPGNAMMEWGRNGQKIWYKIVPDSGTSATSANIYIANYKADVDYEAWSFYDAKGELRDHFYTGIYEPTRDRTGRVRSLSGLNRQSYFYKDFYDTDEPTELYTMQEHIEGSQLNNVYGTDKWYLFQFNNYILTTLLSVLILKSNNIQGKVGIGRSDRPLTTGDLNQKGIFYGTNNYTTDGVKLFGMEHYIAQDGKKTWIGEYNRNSTYRYKLTRSNIDGSNYNDYNYENSANYLQGPAFPRNSNWGKNVIEITYTKYAFFPTAIDYVTNGRYAGDNLDLDKPEITDGFIIGLGTWNTSWPEQAGLFSTQTKTWASSVLSAYLNCVP